MRPTVTLNWKTFGFGAMVALGAIVAIMPSHLSGASLEARLAQYSESLPPGGFTIEPETLASWIVSARPVTLVDLREHWEYDEWHLEGAEHRPLRELVAPSGVGAVREDRPVVVLGRNGPAAGEAVAILRLAGREAYALRGGLEAFWRDVLTPASFDDALPDAERPSIAAKRVEWRARLLGTAVAGSESAASSPPQVSPKPAPVQGKPSKPKASRGKGC